MHPGRSEGGDRGACPGVLLLATHKARPAALVAAVASQPEPAQMLFQVGHYSAVGQILAAAPEPFGGVAPLTIAGSTIRAGRTSST